MPHGPAMVAYYLERFHQGDYDSAFHGLIDLDHAILPHLAEAFHASTDTAPRVFLVRVIWQHRQQSVIPLLAEALLDPQPEIWKEALDGLVALASESALEALRQAKLRRFTADGDSREFVEWLEEAIEQAQVRRAN